jgi:arsenate reductase (thioredoxin)
MIDSAGTHPSTVRQEAIKVLDEIGIDISGNRSKSVNEFAGEKIDYVLTVCDNAKENCPYFPATTKLVHHAFDDPADVEGDEETRLDTFRHVRDQIDAYIKTDFASILEMKLNLPSIKTSNDKQSKQEKRGRTKSSPQGFVN